MSAKPTRIADWEEGQCGIDLAGRKWFRLSCTDLLFSDKNGEKVFATSIYSPFPNCREATLDESARVVFVEYFMKKGKK
jgi:hypothetical protein